MNHSSDPKSPDLQSNEQPNHQLSQQGQNAMMSDNKRRSLITYNHVTYLLYVVSYFTAGLLWIVPIVMNYAKRHDADGTWLATHFDWQIKTFGTVLSCLPSEHY